MSTKIFLATAIGVSEIAVKMGDLHGRKIKRHFISS